MPHTFHPSILRAYDIRGTYSKTLFDADATLLGYKIATYLKENDKTSSTFTVAIIRDGRHSSPALKETLCEALLNTGMNVIDLGIGPSSLGYFVAHTLPIQGIVVVTASHNPKEDNGFKLLLLGKNLCGEDLRTFAALPCTNLAKKRGVFTQRTLLQEYASHACAAAPKNDLKIAWDFSHGAVAVLKPFIEKYISGTHFFLCDTLDGDFPSHAPDPTNEKNLTMLRACVLEKGCDVGFAFDGDGDRLGVVDHTGAMINGDRLVTLLASDVLDKRPGATIIADIKSSRVFQKTISSLGGIPLLCRSGHSFIKTKMKESHALLAGEMSGHIFYADENNGYDDGLYAACRVLRLLQKTRKSLYDLNAALPVFATTPEIKTPVDKAIKFLMVEKLQHYLRANHISFNDADGVRFDTERGWWLMRASHTEDIIMLRFEGEESHDLEAMLVFFREIVGRAIPEYYHFFEDVE